MVQLKNLRCCQASHIAGPHHRDKVLAVRFSMQSCLYHKRDVYIVETLSNALAKSNIMISV